MLVNLAQFLTLDRPLAVLDLETTGFDTEQDRIIQIAITIHYPHREPIQWASLVNPGTPILNVNAHGITDSAVHDSPTFDRIAPALAPKMTNVDIMGYNVEFDIGFMRAGMKRTGVTWEWNGHIIDPLSIYRQRKPMTLSNAYQEFGGEDGQPLPEGSKLEGAHDAGIDVGAAEIVLRGQLLRWKDLPRTVPELAAYCFPRKANALDKKGTIIWHENKVCIAFGKHGKNGPKPLEDVVRMDRRYLEWVLSDNFPPDTKEIIAAALMGQYPTRG